MPVAAFDTPLTPLIRPLEWLAAAMAIVLVGGWRDPVYRSRIHIVPVAINYDRVREDRSLIRELASGDRCRRPSRVTQFREVGRYLWWNAARLVARKWKRYGRAALTVGAPIARCAVVRREPGPVRSAA